VDQVPATPEREAASPRHVRPQSVLVPHAESSQSPSPLGVVDFSDLGRLSTLVDRDLARSPRSAHPLSSCRNSRFRPASTTRFNFHVDPPVQGTWILAAFGIVHRWSRIYALGWVHLYDDGPRGGWERGWGCSTCTGRGSPATTPSRRLRSARSASTQAVIEQSRRPGGADQATVAQQLEADPSPFELLVRVCSRRARAASSCCRVCSSSTEVANASCPSSAGVERFCSRVSRSRPLLRKPHC